MTRVALVALVALVAAAAASAAEPRFAYERTLVTHGSGPYLLLPDPKMSGHSALGFPDLRIVDRNGEPIAWRVLGRPGPPRPWPIKSTTRRERGKRTVVMVDLGALVPAQEIRIRSATPVYDRPVRIENKTYANAAWTPLNEARLSRYKGVLHHRFGMSEVPATHFLRITIENGDDRPLSRIRVTVLYRREHLLVAGGGAPPYTVRYGANVEPPVYDFQRLPRKALGLAHATRARLGPERHVLAASGAKIEKQHPAMRSYRWLVIAGLGLAAIVVGAAGFLVVRRKTPS
jgi:hypothetical protein